MVGKLRYTQGGISHTEKFPLVIFIRQCVGFARKKNYL